jgi:hypothetical protein
VESDSGSKAHHHHTTSTSRLRFRAAAAATVLATAGHKPDAHKHHPAYGKLALDAFKAAGGVQMIKDTFHALKQAR